MASVLSPVATSPEEAQCGGPSATDKAQNDCDLPGGVKSSPDLSSSEKEVKHNVSLIQRCFQRGRQQREQQQRKDVKIGIEMDDFSNPMTASPQFVNSCGLVPGNVAWVEVGPSRTPFTIHRS
jgi:hypothetical protein